MTLQNISNGCIRADAILAVSPLHVLRLGTANTQRYRRADEWHRPSDLTHSAAPADRLLPEQLALEQ